MYSKLIMLLLIVSLLNTGCHGAKETDEIAYILSIGIDKGEAKNLKVSYQIAMPIPEAQGDTSGTSSALTKAEIITIQATNLAEARNLLKSSIARYPNFNHVKAFIIGEELARQGLEDIISPLMRFREYRGTMFVFIAYDISAQEFMNKNKPKFESLPAKYYETAMFSAHENGFYLRTTLHEFNDRLKSNSGAPIATLYGINKLDGKGRDKGPKIYPNKASGLVSGSIQREGGNPAETAGLAVFKKAKMVGILDSEETRMLSILRGEFHGGFILVEDPLVKGKAVNCLMRLGRKPDIQISRNGEKVFIKIKVFLEGSITSTPSGINYEKEEYRVLLENQISELVHKEITMMLQKSQELGADVAGFGYDARSLFKTYQEFMEKNWGELYQTALIEIDVGTRLRRSDFQWRTSPIK